MTTLEEHLEDWLDERAGLRKALSISAVLVYLMGVTTVWLALDQWLSWGMVVLILTVALAGSLRGLADASRLTDKTASRQLTRLALGVILLPAILVQVTLTMR